MGEIGEARSLLEDFMKILLLLGLSLALAAGADVFEAARNNQVADVANYLNDKGDPNRRDAKGHPLLILAATTGL